MISFSSTSMDELKSILKKIDQDYKIVENIHLDQQSLEYKVVLTKTLEKEISPILKSACDKVVEDDSFLNDTSFFEDFSYGNFLNRVQEELNGASRYPGIKRLLNLWSELSTAEKRMAYDYLVDEADEINDELLEVN